MADDLVERSISALEEKTEFISKTTGSIETQEHRVNGRSRNKHAWLVLFVSFLTHLLNPSINYAAGIFHAALLEYYGNDVTMTSWIGAVYTSMFALAGPLASLVTNLFDCRTCVFASGILGLLGFGLSAFVTDIRLLFVTYAVIAGIGSAFAQVASLVVVGYYFPNDAAMASGIVVSGTAAGIFVNPLLIQLFMDWYGLAGAFLLTGALTSHCCIFGLLMRPSKNELDRKRKLKSGRTRSRAILFSIFGGSVNLKKLGYSVSFLMFLLSTLLLAMGYASHVLFLPDYMERSHGATKYEASLIISCIGIGSFISRLFIGALSNDQKVGPELTYFSIIGLTSLLSLFVPVFFKGTSGRLSYGFLLGLYTGGVFSLESTIALNITGVENFALAFGTIMFALGLGYLIGPPIAGSIYNVTGNYNHVFLSSSMMFFASTTCGILMALGKTSRDPVISGAIDMSDKNRKEDGSDREKEYL